MADDAMHFPKSTDDRERRSRFEAVLGAYFEALEAGQSPDRQELLSGHPDLAAELAEFFTEQDRFHRMVEPLRPESILAEGSTTGSPAVTADSNTEAVASPSDPAAATDETQAHPSAETGHRSWSSTPPAAMRDSQSPAGTNADSDDLPRGTKVRYFGDYALLEPLGRGGMGVVYRARQRSLNRLVALKMVGAGRFASADELQRFHNEAEAVAMLDHPHIVPIYEVGQHRHHHYFSMKLVAGGSLADRLEDYAAAPRAAARLVATVARAVHHAHQRGILHRDLKPANILIDEQGEQHVTDFGLARRLEADSGVTQSGAVVGTPSYMAPEQTTGRRGSVTTATDVYGLGAVLYATLTGRAPLGGDSVADTIQRVRERAPEPPSRINRRVSRDPEVVCLKCLEKEPHRRYASAEALAEDLERWLAGLPIAARPVSPAERLWRWSQRNPALASAACVIVASLLAVTGLSAAIAVREARAVERIGLAKRKTDEALGESRRLTARLALDRGQGLCEQGQADVGLLWLARGLQLATDNAGDLQRLLRSNLAGWCQQVHPLRAILEHQGPVLTVAVSRDGKTMLTGGWDNTARLWEDDGTPRGDPWQHQAAVGSAAFGPDGRLALIHTYDGVARQWDVAAGKPLGEPFPHKPVSVAVWSPDGRTVLSGGADGTVLLWDAASKKPVGKPFRHEGRIHECRILAAAFSSDGKTVVTGSNDETARLWETATGKPIGEPMRHQGWVNTVTFSPDGRTVLTGSFDGTARLWDAASGRPVTEPMRHSGGVYAAALSPDGKTILTGGGDRVGRLWDAATGKPLTPPLPHHGGVTQAAFSADGRVVLTGSSDNTARLWDTATGSPLGAPLRHQGFLQAAAFHSDGRNVLSGSYDHTARLWGAAAGPQAKVVRHGELTSERLNGPEPRTSDRGVEARHLRDVMVAIFSRDGRTLLTADAIGTARLWETESGKPIGKAFRQQDPITAATFHPDGKTVVIASGKSETHGEKLIERGEARLWNIADGMPSTYSFNHNSMIKALAVSPDGRIILTGSNDRTARLWDAASGRPIGPPLQHPRLVRTVAFSPDGNVALTADQDVTQRWDVATQQSLGPPLHHQRTALFMDLSFRSDGEAVLVAYDDHTARIYGTITGKPLGPPLRHQGTVNAVAFSPDGKLALTGSQDATARIWDVATGRPVGEPLRHQLQVLKVAFSPDSKSVLTACYDGKAQLWDVVTGRPIGPPWPHPDFARSVAFSPGGEFSLTLNGGDVGRDEARLWRIPAPVAGDAERIVLWVETITGIELDSNDAARALDDAAWRVRRRKLDQLGGPPIR
jgi:WD40 repeat protein